MGRKEKSSNGEPASTQTVDPQGPPDRLQQPVTDDLKPRLDFPVVCLGASAGGLEAYIDFFRTMPAQSGMAFVLVQHLPPQRESLLVDILSKHTEMPVAQVEEGMPIEKNRVYVIRPGHTLTLHEGKLHLGASVKRETHTRPIDDFFRSLAEEQRERAVAVIMSGMGSNGTAGAQAVKAVGGLTIAQDPESAKFPSMPRSLMDAGLADFVLRPGEMAEVIERYAKHSYTTGERTTDALLRRERQNFNEVLAILRTRTKMDFNGYKKPTLVRRIQRRMGLNQIEDLSGYTRLLRQSPGEAIALSDDLLIHVTGFFRDFEAWETLREKVIVPLVREREDGGSIRAWVTACSSGEEAYSLAILICEAAESAGKHFDVKVFATDTAERSLAQARSGVFPGGIESEMPAERLNNFFEREEHVYRVKTSLREMVVFAPQNVLQDPPFSRLDILTCRNLLIYLEPDTQRRLMSLLHFGLREGGALFLGNSETVFDEPDLFEPIDKKWRIYRRIGPTRHGTIEFPMPGNLASALERREEERVQRRNIGRASVAHLAGRILLEDYTPAAVVVDERYRVVYYHGRTEPYLSQPSGEPTRELLMLAREHIRGALRAAFQAAAANDGVASVRDGVVPTSEGMRRLEIKVRPLEKGSKSLLLVSFHEHLELPAPPDKTKSPGDADHKHLEIELVRIRDELQSTIEELQTSNEEMKASNEEITSINEELQSTNEELETSKEELQSLNEELSTVNAQLQVKMEELEATTNDLSSLLASSDIAVIFLDTKFRIRRFTPALRSLVELIPGDVGRPLSDLSQKFADPDLLADAQQVLDRLVPVDREVQGHNQRWYLRRLLPYRTTDNRIDGVVITFLDITDRKHAEISLNEARRTAESANEAKDLFLSMVSHELRTPLSAISLWVKLLLHERANAEQTHQGLMAIQRSAEAQAKLVEDLLDSCRISAGQLRLDLRPTNLSEVVNAAVEAIRPMADEKKIGLSVEVEKDIGAVIADSARVQQMVWNLLSNAVKFTPAKGNISLRVWRDGMTNIEVRDSGVGIDPAFLPHVFTRFRQADNIGQRRQSELGLGLAIVRHLAELHGGGVTADSPGRNMGATFTIRLPTAPTQIQTDSRTVKPPPPLPRVEGMKVLIVEDDADSRHALEFLLSEAGASVVAVDSAAAAVNAISADTFQVVVSDINMPGVDGYLMLRNIRDLEVKRGRPPAHAIALSAMTSPQHYQAAAAAGFETTLAKPIDPEKLLRLLKRLVEG